MFRHPLSHVWLLMDIDKAGRIRSYVQAQLAFVPFYATDFIGPGGSRPEASGLQTPLLTARNPLISTQPDFNPSSAPACIQVQSSKSDPTETDTMPTKKIAKVHKKRPGKRPPPSKEQNRPSRTSRKGSRITSDPDAPSEPTKRERGRHREKPRLPTGLSFLYSFAPKNVGPSRLTVSQSKANLNRRVYNP